MTDHMLYDGSIESIVSINDQEGMTLWSMSYMGLIKGIVGTTSTIQAGRTRGMFMLNASRVLSLIFNALSIFMDASTMQKVQVTS